MFEKNNKWIFNPKQEKIVPVLDMEYGEWKPISRYIEMRCSLDGQSPHFSFDFYEKRVRHLVNSNNEWDELENNVKLIGIAFYPVAYSDQWVMLYGLGNQEFRGVSEQNAIANIFNYYFKLHYDDSEKFIGGRLKSNGNPLPLLFPEWYEWWIKV